MPPKSSLSNEVKGAKFTISLPVAVAHSSPEAPHRDQSPNGGLPGADLIGIKILVVDDDLDSLNILKRILEGRKAIVRAASSASDALAELDSLVPDVIVSDIGMPGVDGFDLIRKIRSRPHGKSIPAIALTALARPADRTKALTAGFQTHIAKPVAATEIIALVRSLADLHH